MTKQISYILRQSNESLPSQSTVDITHNHHRKICPVIKNFAAASRTGASHQQEQINKIHQVRQSETVQLYFRFNLQERDTALPIQSTDSK